MLLEDFEYAVHNNQYETAANMLVEILQGIDAGYGALPNTLQLKSINALSAEELDKNVVVRLASAIGALLAKREFTIADAKWQAKILCWHRWISAIFAASANRNGDAYLRALFNHSISDAEKLKLDPFQLNTAQMHKLAMLFTQESELPLDMDAIWNADKAAAINLGLALLASRFAGSDAAHIKREVLLGWLPSKLREYGSLDDNLSLSVLHDVFMHCSYADRADKHEIKYAINELIRKNLLANGFSDLSSSVMNKKKREGKPKLFVILEWFNTSHSVYRTHSEGLRGLKTNFHTVGFGFKDVTDETAREVFDEFYLTPKDIGFSEQMEFILKHIEKQKPEVILYPSIGMFPVTMYLSNLRLAPIQVTALGHGASSMAKCIDYYAVESDFVGDPACFSEKVLALPKDALPFVRSKALPENLQVDLHESPPPVVKVAVAATTMKYNPNFLKTCQRIIDESTYPVELQFFPGLGIGLVREQLLQTIKHYVPTAVVYSHLAYADYIEKLKVCDLFINPFPYGNMNGIADMLELHMVGVCLTGPQIHEKIDHGMFERVGFPEWTIARTHDEYVAAACKLIDDHRLRYKLRKGLQKSGAAQVLYQGRPEILSEKLFALLEEKN